MNKIASLILIILLKEGNCLNRTTSCIQNLNCDINLVSSNADNNSATSLRNKTQSLSNEYLKQGKVILGHPKPSNSNYTTRLINHSNPPELNCVVKRTPQELNPRESRNYQPRKWLNGVLYMQIDPAFSAIENTKIIQALYDLHDLPCIKIGLWPAQFGGANYYPSGDYVYIKKGQPGTGCWSYVGRIGGKQELNLEPGCVYHRTIIHESMHALGFQHEQCRGDRNDYVDILWQNIKPGFERNFAMIPAMPTFNVPYDYNSIMHYSNWAFSKNRQMTITAKNGSPVGSTNTLTEFDKLKLKAMYC